MPIYGLFFDSILPVYRKNTGTYFIKHWILSVYGEKQFRENRANRPIKLWEKDKGNSEEIGKKHWEQKQERDSWKKRGRNLWKKRGRKLWRKKRKKNLEKKEKEKSGKKRGRKLWKTEGNPDYSETLKGSFEEKKKKALKFYSHRRKL